MVKEKSGLSVFSQVSLLEEKVRVLFQTNFELFFVEEFQYQTPPPPPPSSVNLVIFFSLLFEDRPVSKFVDRWITHLRSNNDESQRTFTTCDRWGSANGQVWMLKQRL